MPGNARLKVSNRYLTAILLVVLAFCTREAMVPLLGETRVAFSTFYLAVVLSAYFCGVGPATCASILSAAVAYWAFVSPAYAPKFDVDSLTSMAFFGLTSAVDIYFITGMRRALNEYRLERTRAERLAQGNADLFREFNERATTHLQLVAALLHLRSREGLDAAYSNALADASRRTLMISRVHRSLNHGAVPLTDFSGFTRQLLAAFVEAADHHDIRVIVSGDEIMLRFRKSGETARTRFVIEQRDGQKELVLRSDPRNEGTQRYRFRPASLGDVEVEGPLAVSPSDASADGSGLERMWIDLQKFATGGQAFSMYQLSKHTVAGSKLGWFHAGDFDDWSTEAFVYRLEPGALSMTFLVRGDRGTTPFRVAEDPRERNNVLTLESDPRDFHARHRYANAGPSF